MTFPVAPLTGTQVRATGALLAVGDELDGLARGLVIVLCGLPFVFMGAWLGGLVR